jgi:hypothetical protein
MGASYLLLAVGRRMAIIADRGHVEKRSGADNIFVSRDWVNTPSISRLGDFLMMRNNLIQGTQRDALVGRDSPANLLEKGLRLRPTQRRLEATAITMVSKPPNPEAISRWNQDSV